MCACACACVYNAHVRRRRRRRCGGTSGHHALVDVGVETAHAWGSEAQGVDDDDVDDDDGISGSADLAVVSTCRCVIAVHAYARTCECQLCALPSFVDTVHCFLSSQHFLLLWQKFSESHERNRMLAQTFIFRCFDINEFSFAYIVPPQSKWALRFSAAGKLSFLPVASFIWVPVLSCRGDGPTRRCPCPSMALHSTLHWRWGVSPHQMRSCSSPCHLPRHYSRRTHSARKTILPPSMQGPSS